MKPSISFEPQMNQMDTDERRFGCRKKAQKAQTSALGICFLLSAFSFQLFSPATALAVTSDNPYVNPITNRNLFSLKAPARPEDNLPPAPPPNIPKIKFVGITTLMGGQRAVLRIPRPARPPQPASEISLMLQESGPMEEGVKVLKIDTAAATVKIENNGTVQTLDLENDAPASAPAPAAGGIPIPGKNPAGAIPVPKTTGAPAAAGGGVTSIPRPVRSGTQMASSGTGATQGGGIIGAGPSGIAEPEQPPPLTAQEQEVLIEVQKEQEPGLPWPPTSIGEQLQAEQQAENQSPSPL